MSDAKAIVPKKEFYGVKSQLQRTLVVMLPLVCAIAALLALAQTGYDIISTS